ncbi:MAG TPA: metalloregulator ArsR/SmtB family transcription factor [Candidatus Peribacterales bacterium]|nr:metalloregulator ArsR/SmtB family transcription factor [Candidatus Peribacterales bacterium]
MTTVSHRPIDMTDPMEVPSEERLAAKLPDPLGNSVESLVECCTVFTADTRFRIGHTLLREQSPCVKDLMIKLSQPQPTVSYHLKALSKNGFVMDERKGKQHFFHPSDRLRQFLFPLFANNEELSTVLPAEFEFPDLTQQEMQKHVATLRLIADEQRLRIGLKLGQTGEVCVGDICCLLRSKQPGVSHHISLLHHNEFVFARRDGRRTHYRMTRKFFALLTALCGKGEGDEYDDA